MPAPVFTRVPGATAAALAVLLQELEEDPEMRSKVALYRDPAYNPAAAPPHGMADSDDDEDGEGVPQVPLEELLDDLAALGLEEEEEEGGGVGAVDGGLAGGHYSVLPPQQQQRRHDGGGGGDGGSDDEMME